MNVLTAEQVRKVLLYHLPHREYYSIEQTDGWQKIANELNAELGSDPYDAVSCEHVISPDTLHLILDEWDAHPGWTATNENMAQLFSNAALGDECKFNMTKTKQQLRTEVMKRLTHSWNACIRDTRQLFGSLVGKEAPIYAERNDYDALIDLLTDDKIPDDITCEQVLIDCDDGLMPPFTAHCSLCETEWGFTPRFCPECRARVVGTRDERKR